MIWHFLCFCYCFGFLRFRHSLLQILQWDIIGLGGVMAKMYAAARTLFLDLLWRLHTIEYSNIQQRLLTSRSEVKNGQTTTKLQTISLLIDRWPLGPPLFLRNLTASELDRTRRHSFRRLEMKTGKQHHLVTSMMMSMGQVMLGFSSPYKSRMPVEIRESVRVLRLD